MFGAKMRYHKIDGLRGLTLISMVAYHACWDLVYLFHMNMPWYRGQAGFLWQQSICWGFILLSGFSLGLGSRPVRRGVIVSLAGLLVTLVTVRFMPDDRIVFGVLTFLGCAMILTGLGKKQLQRIPCVPGLCAAFLLFWIWYPVNRGYLRFVSCSSGNGSLRIALSDFPLPQSWYRGLPMTFLGFMEPDFFSTDYFSMLPWIFLFAAGFYLYQMLKRFGGMAVLEKGWLPPAEWLGRHSLAVYLVHQPLVFGILQAVL